MAVLATKVRHAIVATTPRPVRGLMISVEEDHLAVRGRVPSEHVRRTVMAAARQEAGEGVEIVDHLAVIR
jgi:hypothetical protein